MSATDRHACRHAEHERIVTPRRANVTGGSSRAAAGREHERTVTARALGTRNGSSRFLVSRRASALARRVTPRDGRNARPVDHGTDRPVPGVKVERPQAAACAPDRHGRAGRGRGRTTLTPGGLGRVVFPPGEGIGRTRTGAGSRPRRGRSWPSDGPSHEYWSCNSSGRERPTIGYFSAPREVPGSVPSALP